MPEKKRPAALPQERPAPPVPEVEKPDPRSAQFQKEVREEIEKEKLDP